jgi:hypothetical protein
MVFDAVHHHIYVRTNRILIVLKYEPAQLTNVFSVFTSKLPKAVVCGLTDWGTWQRTLRGLRTVRIACSFVGHVVNILRNSVRSETQ